MILDSKIPEGPLSQKWTNYKAAQKLVNPANKRKLDIIEFLGRLYAWVVCLMFAAVVILVYLGL